MGGKRLLSLTGVVAGLMFGVGALAFGGGAQAQESTIQGTTDAAVAAWNDGDAEAFIANFTDSALESLLGPADGDVVAYVEASMEETGPIAAIELSNIKLEAGVFTANADVQFEAGGGLYFEWEFTQTADGWVISSSTEASRPIPPGVPAVDLDLTEYAFGYNAAAIQAADGNFAFDVTNSGAEEHEVVLFEITTDAALGDVVEAIAASGEDEQPEGIGEPQFLGFFGPGQTGTAIPAAPLAAGRYGLICFLPAPDGTPHAFLGMVSEFTVGSMVVDPTPTPAGGGGITPPSTGDAGLLDVESGAATWVMLGLALTLTLGGAVGVVRSRQD